MQTFDRIATQSIRSAPSCIDCEWRPLRAHLKPLQWARSRSPVTTISLRCDTINGSDPALHVPNNPEHQISIFFIEIRKEFPIACLAIKSMQPVSR